MEQRKRAITYGETLQAKEFARVQEELFGNKNIPEKKIDQTSSTISGVKISTLPSGGVIYPDGAEIYFSPMTFGEMKFLSGSSMSDKETVEFFLKKISCTFPVENLTYFDFYYITVLIKMSTFGENDYNIVFECNKCGHVNKKAFKQDEIDFDEIQVEMPVTVDMPDGSTVTFEPLTVGNYLKMVKRGLAEDYDVYMAYCMKGVDHLTALDIIKNEFSGEMVNILETIDATFYHGVRDLKIKCNHKEMKGTGEFDIDGEEISVEEVCGVMHKIPFLTLPEYTITSDRTKESLRNRIHFGIQNAHKSEGSE